ncbi:UNVERIFIED_CONTAM: hypothetical protein HDU68_002623 [Siphonaria sp. JEL0065]|nr:hypothetical protein HDU68_002623 [Siphonaria sp. JEL0065]
MIGARSMGHCSDFAQYIFHGNARLATDQLDTSIFHRKTEKCPSSLYLHGEYLIWQILESPTKVRANLWMPNLEQVSTDDLKQIRNFDLILCKTHITCTAFDKYLQHHNFTSPKTVFMSHSSPDTYQTAIQHLGDHTVKSRKRDYNKFFHVYGGSGRKSTVELVNCWQRHRTWPTLTIVGHHDKQYFMERFKRIPWNLQVLGGIPSKQLRELQLTHGVHICPSQMEGYGHYINEARALGSLVVTTDYAPMNEFVEDGVSGILVNHLKPKAELNQAMADYFVSPVKLNPEHICGAMERVMKLSIKERKAMGMKARRLYEKDNELMIRNIGRLLDGDFGV